MPIEVPSAVRTQRRAARRAFVAAALLGILLALPGCSLRRFAVDRMASALAAGSAGWGEDDDPELVGAALPFALKTLESLLAESPDNDRLLLAACRGFVAYAAGFVEPEAERLPAEQFTAAERIRARALRLHLRARGYCRRALELSFPAAAAELGGEPVAALAGVGRDGVELLYWLGAAWGSAIALGPDRPELVADLPIVRAVLERALALEPGFDRGALEEAMLPLDALPAHLGGSSARARERLERAVALADGSRASPWVTWARSDAVARQDRRGFRLALERALAVDPDASPPDRLANRIAQDRARRLLARADELFVAAEEEGSP